jgi:ADP-heptose:LPS heptosyltransferase
VKILYILGGGLGNVVHALPALAAMKSCGHTVTVWVGEAWPNLALLIDHDDVRTGDPPNPAEYDRVFQTPYALTGVYGHLADTLGKVAESSALPLGGGSPHTEVDVNMWFARVCGYDGIAPPPVLCLPPGDMPKPTTPYIVIAPGVQWKVAVWRKKEYPHWMDVAAMLNGKNIVWLGCAEDSLPEFDTVGTNLCGKTDLLESIAVLSCADAVLAVDNGLSCVSAALGVPTVVLWGPTDEVKNRKYGPRVANVRTPLSCAPCQYGEALVDCTHANCMRAIPPQAIVSALKGLVPEVIA